MKPSPGSGRPCRPDPPTRTVARARVEAVVRRNGQIILVAQYAELLGGVDAGRQMLGRSPLGGFTLMEAPGQVGG